MEARVLLLELLLLEAQDTTLVAALINKIIGMLCWDWVTTPHQSPLPYIKGGPLEFLEAEAKKINILNC